MHIGQAALKGTWTTGDPDVSSAIKKLHLIHPSSLLHPVKFMLMVGLIFVVHKCATLV